MLRSWACRESVYHCPHIKQINVASKSGDNIGLVWKFIEASFEDITIIKLRITYTKSSLSYLLAFYGIPIFNTLEHFLWHAHALGHNGYIKVACVYCLRLFVVIYFSTKVQTLGALETCAAPLIGLFLLVYTRGLFPAR